MRTMKAGELRARLGEALDAASAGERLVIERDHRPIAAIVPLEDVQHLEGTTDEARRRKLEALERIRERALRMRSEYPPPDDGFPDSAAWLRWDRDHGHGDW
jgi:prevent-host-death family protein